MKLKIKPRVKQLPYKLYQANFLDIVKQIPDNSIHLVVTDPPYRVISGGRGEKSGHFNGYDRIHKEGTVLSKNDGKIFKHNDINCKIYLPEIYRVMATNSHLYLMTNNLNLEDMLNQCRLAGFKLHNVLVWKKNSCTANRWYMKDLEYTIFVRKGKAFPINDMGSKQSFEFPNVKSKQHPTEKPVALMQHYVKNSSQIGQTVLDPFMGSGTTGIACLNTNRRFIGMELDPEYFRLAKERIDRAYETKNEKG